MRSERSRRVSRGQSRVDGRPAPRHHARPRGGTDDGDRIHGLLAVLASIGRQDLSFTPRSSAGLGGAGDRVQY